MTRVTGPRRPTASASTGSLRLEWESVAGCIPRTCARLALPFHPPGGRGQFEARWVPIEQVKFKDHLMTKRKDFTPEALRFARMALARFSESNPLAGPPAPS